MKRFALSVWVLLTAMMSVGAANEGLEPLIQNVYSRDVQLLNGSWHYLLDQLEVGYYDYRREPTDNGFFKDHQVNNVDSYKEYDFDAAPVMAIPGDWNTWEDRFLHYEGTMWFKKDFLYEPDGGRAYLYIGAANYDAKVYVNGVKVGEHIGGYTPFNMEVTDVLKPGKNFVVVKVDNKRYLEAVPTVNCDWFNFGGITRDVMIVNVPKTYIRNYKLQLKKDSQNVVAGFIQLDGEKAQQKVSVEIPELKVKKEYTTEAPSRCCHSLREG